MLKDASKESDFHADFKYISFIKFSLCHHSYEPEKICLILENRGKQLLKVIESLKKITSSHSAYQRILQQIFQAPIYKNVEFRIFCQQTDHGCVFICFFLFLFSFPQGSSYRPSGPRMLQELILTEMKSFSALFK